MPSFLIPVVSTVAIVIAAILVITLLIKSCWKVAGTNEVLIVSGMGKVKRKTGGGTFVIPLLQRVQRILQIGFGFLMNIKRRIIFRQLIQEIHTFRQIRKNLAAGLHQCRNGLQINVRCRNGKCRC